MVIIGFDDPGIRLIVKDFILRADRLQRAEGIEDPALAGRGVIAQRDLVPVEIAAVQIAAVVPLQRILVVSVIVLLADLVAAVQDRNAALREQESVEHDVQTDIAVELAAVKLVFGGFDPAQRSGGAAEARVAQARIIIVELTAGIAAVALAGQIIVEILFVRDFLHAELFQVLIIKSPADIVMAAQIVQEGVVVRQLKDRLHLVAEQAHVVGRHGMPGAGHRGDVVEHMALRLLDGAEIRDDLGGLHDDLAQKQGAGADDLGRHPHQADQRVDLREVAAVRAELFPDIRRRVEADDVHPVVAQVEHIRGHVVEDHRVSIVQIPLIRIEGGHDDLARLLTPGKVPGRGRREDLGNSLFEFIRDRPVVVEEIPVLVFLLPGTGALRPLMVLTRVVHDKVEADTHAVVVALVAQLRQVLHRPQLRLHLPEIRNRIAAVAPARRALQKRHQVDVVQSALLQIVQMLAHTLERARKAVRVHEHAQHLISPVPLRDFLAHLIPLLELRRALRIILIKHTAEILERLLVIVVELCVKPLEFIIVLCEPLRKFRLPVLAFKHVTVPPNEL